MKTKILDWQWLAQRPVREISAALNLKGNKK